MLFGSVFIADIITDVSIRDFISQKSISFLRRDSISQDICTKRFEMVPKDANSDSTSFLSTHAPNASLHFFAAPTNLNNNFRLNGLV